MVKAFQFKAANRFDRVFEVSILLKALDGILEIISGVLLLFIKPEYLNHLATFLTQSELSADPHDIIATFINNALHRVDHGTLIFGALYLLAHGLVKVVLVAEILRNRLWAYPGLIVVTAAFMVYQSYRFAFSHSITLALLTLFDAVVVYLTLVEYYRRRRHLSHPGSPVI